MPPLQPVFPALGDYDALRQGGYLQAVVLLDDESAPPRPAPAPPQPRPTCSRKIPLAAPSQSWWLGKEVLRLARRWRDVSLELLDSTAGTPDLAKTTFQSDSV